MLKMRFDRSELEVAVNAIPVDRIDTSGQRDDRNAQEE
jgi:hypothetical protein